MKKIKLFNELLEENSYRYLITVIHYISWLFNFVGVGRKKVKGVAN